MNTIHRNPRVYTVTDDQAFEISVRQSEAAGLLYLLGTVAAKEQHGLSSNPSLEEQSGIYDLVAKVNENMKQTYSAVFGSFSPNAAPQSADKISA